LAGSPDRASSALRKSLMLTLILSLTDRLIALLKAGHERDRKLYEDFMQEFCTDMERLHQNYLEAFARYRGAIEQAPPPLSAEHPLLQEIQKDLVFTDQLRAPIRTLTEYRKDPVFGKLSMTATSYLVGSPSLTGTLLNGQRPLLNAARTRAIEGLKEIFAGEAAHDQKVKAGVALVDVVVGELQGSYGAFKSAASHTKRQLLDKRL
jgi:hypothetical protein